MARKLDPVKEHERLEALRVYEREYGMYGLIAGVDEAGRGPLVGNVVTACVVMPLDTEPILWIDDSKKLTAKKREALFDVIKEKALAYGIASVSADEIDKYNIYEATKICMK